ncbi:MAG: hypothetical protein ACEPO8_10600 [Rhodothermaceae bacterium]
MNRKKSFKIDEKLLEKIVSVAYGNAGFIDKLGVRRLAKKYPEVKEALENYEKTAKELKKMDFSACPDELIENVEKLINIDKKKERSLFSDLGSIFITKPLYSAAAVTIFVIAILFSTTLERNFEHSEFSKQEVEVAGEQVEKALALIGKVFNTARTTIEKDILTKQVSNPLNESVKSVNDLFTKENKNEKSN